MRKAITMAGAALTLAGGGTVAATAGADKTENAALEPHLVPMQEIAVPIIDGDRLDGTFRVKTFLAADDAEAAERIEAALPRLRSASLAAALEFSRLHASPFRPVDAEMLSKDLTEALQSEEPGVTRALVVEVVASPA
ncbi:hypothetical protein ABVV53_02720 [Novosphingobium sp. RD2P27]|uniref:Uncharacterized protein n=1 Tax=Novosphingobium kalidii TaxID=3230299 RepID=A0ABV2CXQ8_9SPHN